MLNPQYQQQFANQAKQYRQSNQGSTTATSAAGHLLTPEYQHLKSQYDFYNQLQPLHQQMLGHYMSILANPGLASQQYRGNSMAQANANLPMIQNQVSGNFGIGEKNALALNNQNMANQNANAFDANLYSPEGQAQAAQGFDQAYQASSPDVRNFNTLAQTQWGKTQAPDNTLGGIGALIGGLGAAGLKI